MLFTEGLFSLYLWNPWKESVKAFTREGRQSLVQTNGECAHRPILHGIIGFGRRLKDSGLDTNALQDIARPVFFETVYVSSDIIHYLWNWLC